jgi:uncharacterized protein YutE (UPF0331/DUF86 family)
MDVKTNTVFYEKLKFVFIEMPDFNKPLNELRSKYEKWIYLLKYIADMQNIPDNMKKNRIFEKFGEQAELANMTQEELDLYDESLKIYRNMYTTENIIEDYQRVNKKLRRSVITYKKENTTLQQQNVAFQKENEELRRLLGLRNIQSN